MAADLGALMLAPATPATDRAGFVHLADHDTVPVEGMNLHVREVREVNKSGTTRGEKNGSKLASTWERFWERCAALPAGSVGRSKPGAPRSKLGA